MKLITIIVTTVFLLISVQPTTAHRPITTAADPCKSLPDPRTLRSDQITVLINGYSESRLHLLRSIATTYSSNPTVASVLILWGNPTTPLKTLTQLSVNLTAFSGSAPISIHHHPTTSLNSRFLPRSSITTRVIAIVDDDVEVDSASFDFAFKTWSVNQDRLIGFFARSHDLDLSNKVWIYSVHPDKYSMVLTKFMILKTDYLHKYTCGGGEKMNQMRDFVDKTMNCEDILMNFVVADESNAGPILVEAKRLRDHGDARNEEEEEDEGGEKKVREVGLSSRRGEHRKRRGECIREFHKVLGRMPLKYSYGKVVNSVGEQGLCQKSGKLVFCDE